MHTFEKTNIDKKNEDRIKNLIEYTFLMYLHFILLMWVFSKLYTMDTHWMSNLILHPTSVYTLILSKPTKR